MLVQVTLPFDAPLSEVKRIALAKAGMPSSFFCIVKKSLDARKAAQGSINVCYTVALSPDDIAKPFAPPMGKALENRPIIVGFGPSGIFAAYVLALSGNKPIVYERGDDIDQRTRKVNKFWSNGVLDSESNVQFGEGGAGLFSDGKLMTQVDSPYNSFVLDTLAEFGAPEEARYYKHAHIGSDNLSEIVKRLRKEIIRLGGEIHFSSRVTEIMPQRDGVAIKVGNTYQKTKHLILAIGHSARDTYREIIGKLEVEAKAYAVGVRIEHLRKLIDEAQYKRFAGNPLLGAAEYKLVNQCGGRSCYSFCMCPGGVVVASSSNENEIVTNGMSLYKRDGINSNSAIVVNVGAKDFGDYPEQAITFQEKLEKAAFELGGGGFYAPVQLLDDFRKGRSSTRFGEVKPTYQPGTTFARLDLALPQFITDTIRQSIDFFDRRVHGFASKDSVLTGFETRTSAPLRVLRDEKLSSLSSPFIYPVGEGCGYAGGIVSAAIDGVRAAERVLL